MTQEDKELLLKVLCAMLPYHVRCKIWLKDGTTEEGALDLEHNYADVLLNAFYYNNIKDIKPYLRPMSSMTEEERRYIHNKFGANNHGSIETYSFESFEGGHSEVYMVDMAGFIDWLNAHYFDYRGLIEKGLAIEAPKGMYN